MILWHRRPLPVATRIDSRWWHQPPPCFDVDTFCHRPAVWALGVPTSTTRQIWHLPPIINQRPNTYKGHCISTEKHHQSTTASLKSAPPSSPLRPRPRFTTPLPPKKNKNVLPIVPHRNPLPPPHPINNSITRYPPTMQVGAQTPPRSVWG